VAVYNAVGVTSIYINGVAESGTYAGTATALAYSTNNGYIGGPSTGYLKAKLDEVAIWGRALNASEVLQLYRRGINRVKYQARSCVDASCACRAFSTSPVGSATDCSGNGTADDLTGTDPLQANWFGPDGTSATYFSELQNNSSVDSSGTPTGAVAATGLNLNWAGTFFPAAARPSNNQYFQYRVFMESDDETGMCSGGILCQPQISSITVAPTGRRYGGSPSITYSTGISFTTLNTLTRTDSGSCTTYQVSIDDGSTWKYWNGSAWATATTSAQSNYLSDYAGHLSSLAAGNFRFKAFLNTSADLTQTCNLNSVELTYIP
jgi:hypothetical protein